MKRRFLACLGAAYTTVENAGDYAIERSGEELRICFEWSDGREDWKNNFDFPAKPYRDMKDLWFCHRGFLRVWKSIEPHVEREIMDAGVKRIEVIGYSHGGAIAALCYEYIRFNRPDVEVSGVGFGAPRVFWGPRRKAVMDRFAGFEVVRNGRDIVTHLPPAVLGYRHVGRVVKIGRSKGLIEDHRDYRYMEGLGE